jgi:hypothetical protein
MGTRSSRVGAGLFFLEAFMEHDWDWIFSAQNFEPMFKKYMHYQVDVLGKTPDAWRSDDEQNKSEYCQRLFMTLNSVKHATEVFGGKPSQYLRYLDGMWPGFLLSKRGMGVCSCLLYAAAGLGLPLKYWTMGTRCKMTVSFLRDTGVNELLRHFQFEVSFGRKSRAKKYEGLLPAWVEVYEPRCKKKTRILLSDLEWYAGLIGGMSFVTPLDMELFAKTKFALTFSPYGQNVYHTYTATPNVDLACREWENAAYM